MDVELAIIGAGPVGLFSVFQAGMLGIKSCVIDNLDIIGGQCSKLYPEKPIYDIPAYPVIRGAELIDRLSRQAEIFNPKIFLSRQVISLNVGYMGSTISSTETDNTDNRNPESDNNQLTKIFTLETSGGEIIKSRAVIIAAGAGAFGPNRPPLSGIKDFEGKSVFYSITQKDNFAGKNIVIAGGGDSALDWAISLADIAKVYLVHRRNKFKAAPLSVQKVTELAGKGVIELVTNYQLSSLKGQNGILEEVIVSDLAGNNKSLKADILLPFFGLAQNLGPILNFGLNIKNHHIEVTTPYYETNIPGIYAIGDIATYEGKLKLILTGFAEAAAALHHAYGRIFDGKALHFEYSTSKGITPLPKLLN